MPLEVGIVGLPQVGKTTLFNALTAGGADTAGFGRADKPNIGTARVPDPRLKSINQFIATDRIVPATIQVVDVAGLVRGASTGQGLGNKFLSHVRDMDALIHVVRCFASNDVAHVEGSIDPARDIETVEGELILADLEQVSTSLSKAERAARGGDKESIARVEILKMALAHLNELKPVREISFTPEQRKILKSMGLLTAKKVLYVANVGEDDVAGTSPAAQAVKQCAATSGGGCVIVCGKLEAEIAELKDEDRGEMLAAMNLTEPALAVLAREAYKLLGLHSFFTAGPMEIKAWTIPIGATAPQAAGAIHSDFERGFIRAEIYTVDDLTQHKTEAAIKSAGKLRVEGKNYIFRDGDVAHFLFNV